MTFISRGVTAESDTHYRGITALFSWFVPIPGGYWVSAVTIVYVLHYENSDQFSLEC